MRRGFTILELALVFAVAGLTMAIALPRIASLRDGWTAEQAAQAIVQAHRRARITAILLSRPLTLTVAPDSLVLATATDSVIWRAPGPAAGGATFTGRVRRLTFTPVGVTSGLSNATFRLSVGAAVRTVVISRLGRVRLLRGS